MRLTSLTVWLASLACCGPAVTGARDLPPAHWGGSSFELVDEAGRALPTYSHDGRTYVLGAVGQRYLVRVRNDSPRRVEVVVSVDGRDVIDGGAAEWSKRGYVVDAYATVTLDGYRLGQDSVAAFRFSSVSRSYAARQGDARDVGVIGVAVFPERRSALPPRIASQSFRSGANDTPGPAIAPEAEGARHDASAPAAKGADATALRRQGLGTEFGEEHASHVQLVSFQRASPRPEVVLTARYDDRAGLVAAGVLIDPRREEQRLRRSADPFRRDAGYARPPPGWSGGRTGS